VTDRPLIPRGPRELQGHVRYADDGLLLALVADGEEDPLAFLNTPEGSPPPTREAIAEHVADLDADALNAIVEAAVAEGESIRGSDDPITPEVLARIELLADAREVAEERRTAIAEEERARQEAAEAGLSRLLPPPGSDSGGEDDNDPGENDSGDDVEPPAPLAASGAHSGAQPPAAPPAARRRQVSAVPRPGAIPSTPAPGSPAAQPGAYTPLRARSALVAAAGLESVGLETGGEIETRAQLGAAINRKREALRGTTGGNGEKLTVASIRTEYPEERQLGGSLDINTARINAATAPDAMVAAAEYVRSNGALVAAGGLCGPIEELYDVPVIGTARRPVRDALANFGADRGGVRWRQHVSFGDFAAGTGFWSLADDAAVTGDPDTEPKTKPCVDVVCPDDAEAYVEAITWCMTFSNVTSRFDPESTAANVEAGGIAHARIAENRLMAQIAALCTSQTQGPELSLIRDYLTMLDRLFAAVRNFYRLEDTDPLHGVGPRWMRDAIRSDLTRGAGFASGTEFAAMLAAADAQISQYIASRGVNWTWHLDGRPAIVGGAGVPAMDAQFYGALTPGGAVPDYPDNVETLIWVEGTMLHLDGGTMDFGVMRDSSLNQVNRYKQFSETFEGVAHRGVEAFRVVSPINPNGMTAGTADTAAILAA
jgi:hypothetical protein